MSRSVQVSSVALALLLAAACSSEAPSEATADAGDAVQGYQGHALHGHEVRVFRPCGSDEPLWAIDPSGLLWEQYKRFVPDPASAHELFAVVKGREIPAPADGFGADYPGALRIESVLYAGLEGPGCDLNWEAFAYRVSGNEPFWSVVVTDHDMRLSRLGAEERVWSEISLEHLDGGLRYFGEEGGSTDAELTISNSACVDSMSGSYYAFTGILRMSGDELRGCALRGRP